MGFPTLFLWNHLSLIYCHWCHALTSSGVTEVWGPIMKAALAPPPTCNTEKDHKQHTVLNTIYQHFQALVVYVI